MRVKRRKLSSDSDASEIQYAERPSDIPAGADSSAADANSDDDAPSENLHSVDSTSNVNGAKRVHTATNGHVSRKHLQSVERNEQHHSNDHDEQHHSTDDDEASGSDDADARALRVPVPATVSAVRTSTAPVSFASLGVHPWLVASLAAMAIKRPTSIQKATIPAILAGHDCIGGSRTGSGKTVAFTVPILQKWAEDPTGIFALILTPTRELALQIWEQVKAISAPQALKPLLITGGVDMRTQALGLAARPHIVIATPGRLADHVHSSGTDTTIGLRRVRFVVFDEADRLLAPGPGSMLPDLETCLSVLPPAAARQTCLFTATLTPEVRALKDKPTPPGKPPLFMHDVDTATLAVPASLRETYLQTPVTQRESYLHALLLTPANQARLNIIIFTNRTRTAQMLEHMLRLLEHRVTALHSALPQAQRTANLARFRARAARILVATDVASRGLDIPDVALVINYDVPRDPDDYIHRVGRTARAGREGMAVTMVGQRDVELVLAIEQRTGTKMVAFAEEGVNVETRVVRDALKPVSEAKTEALLRLEEGREVTGRRTAAKVKKLKR